MTATRPSPPRRRRPRPTSLAILGVAVALALTVDAAAAAAPVVDEPDGAVRVDGAVLTTETFTKQTVEDARWKRLDDACLTAAAPLSSPGDSDELGGCLRVQDSPENLGGGEGGFLQLTDNSRDRTGGAVLDRAFPSSAGLRVTFDQYQYGVSDSGIGHADGIGFFLADGAYSLTRTGAYGGALGYSVGELRNDPGLPHGYLGVGLDAYGYSTFPTFDGEGCEARPEPAGLVPGTVILRGPGNGIEGYCLLDSAPYPDVRSAPTEAPGGQTGTRQRVTVTVGPTTVDDPYPLISVAVNGDVLVEQRAVTPAPPTLKMGFAGATGQGYDVHLVRLESVTTIEALSQLDLVTTVDHSDSTGTDRTAFTEGDVVPWSHLVTNVGDEAVSDVVVSAPGGQLVQCAETTIPAHGSITCTSTGGPLGAVDTASGRARVSAEAVATTGGGATIRAAADAEAPAYRSSILSVTKTVSGSGSARSALPDDTVFTVDYSWPATAATPGVVGEDGRPLVLPAGRGSLAVPVGGTVFADGRVPAGAVVTLTESAPPTVRGHSWSGPVVTPSPVVAAGTGTTTVLSTSALDRDLASLTLTKTVETQLPTRPAAVGDTVTYRFEMTNTGRSVLSDVMVVDDLDGLSEIVVRWPGPEGELLPGASATAVATYVLDQDDIDAGSIVSTAVASGFDALGDPVRSDAVPSAVRLQVVAAPAPAPAAPAVEPVAAAAVPAPGTLAMTGTPGLAPVVALGLALVVAGGLALAVTADRRRRRAS